MTETQTTICNKALGLVGGNHINSVQDTTQEALWCKTYYDLSLNVVLSEGAWKHATVEEELVRVEKDEYSEEQKYVFAIPANCVLILRVFKKENRKKEDNETDWSIRHFPSDNTDYIICNEKEDLMIEYVYNNSNLTKASGKFIEALAAKLACNICMPVTHDLERYNMMLQLYQNFMNDALRDDYNETGEDKIDWISPITASRENY